MMLTRRQALEPRTPVIVGGSSIGVGNAGQSRG
jgi:hypothetical protein